MGDMVMKSQTDILYNTVHTCDFRMDYTAIGDTVNTAARLEANAKAGQVLISQKIYDRLKDRIKVNEVGVIPLKGKSEGVFVYELVDIHNDNNVSEGSKENE